MEKSILLFTIVTYFFTLQVFGATFTLLNKCDYTVWPGLLSGAGTAPLSTTGFSLQKGETKSVTVPSSWSGRLWGRTRCSQNTSTDTFTCGTGDCGSGKVECTGGTAATPATLAEFTLNGAGGQDFYDVSLVDGYNLPMLVVPQGGTGPNCTTTGCAVDLNGACPSELKVVDTKATAKVGVACKSACDAFGDAQYCCSGAYGSPDTCKPSSYSEAFKSACPLAYSYAYDDKTSTFTCGSSPDYLITFCPSPNTSQKSSAGDNNNNNNNNTSSSSSNPSPDSEDNGGGMVYEGLLDVSNGGIPSNYHFIWWLQMVVIMAAILRLF